MNNTLDKIVTKLLSADKITLITHVRPDGDTLGSAFALKHALLSKGKNVKVVCESNISPRYLFLSSGKDNICDECEGIIVCVDVASPELSGKKYSDIAKNADIVIDHHTTTLGYGKLNLIDPSAAACGEIVYKLCLKLGIMNKFIAECLYTAISTDTGCFVFANTTSDTHSCAAELIKAGIDVSALNKLLFRTKSVSAFEIERLAFETLEYFYDKTITCMKIPLDAIKKLQATEDDMEGISSIPAQIEGVKASATFREIDVDTFKVSIRTNGDIDGAQVCKNYGGGGHKMAAGCTVYGDYDSIKKEIAESLHNNERRNNITE